MSISRYFPASGTAGLERNWGEWKQAGSLASAKDKADDNFHRAIPILVQKAPYSVSSYTFVSNINEQIDVEQQYCLDTACYSDCGT